MDSAASVDMCNLQAVFIDYIVFKSVNNIQSMGGQLQAIGIGTIYALFIPSNRITIDTFIQETFYILDLFTNLISLGMLLEKGYSFDTKIFYALNKLNKKVAYALLSRN